MDAKKINEKRKEAGQPTEDNSEILRAIEVKKKEMRLREIEVEVLTEYLKKGDFSKFSKELLDVHKEYQTLLNEVGAYTSNLSSAEKVVQLKEELRLMKYNMENPIK